MWVSCLGFLSSVLSTEDVNLFFYHLDLVYDPVQRGAPVSRRYSEFTFLWDCLVRRYPFRLLPQLPPKRIGGMRNFCSALVLRLLISCTHSGFCITS